MAKLSYRCIYCSKKQKIQSDYLGKAIRCPKCEQCQVVPESFSPTSYPKGFGFLILTFVLFNLLSGTLFLKSQPEISRLERLQKEAQTEEYYGNYSMAMYHYSAIKRELVRLNLAPQLQEIDQKIQELQKLQKQKNSLKKRKGEEEWKKDFQSQEK